MKPPRLSIRTMVALVIVAGFDSAVLVRAYQRGARAGAIAESVVGFGAVLVVAHVAAVPLVRAVARVRHQPPGERLLTPVTPWVVLALYLAVLLIPILAILFLRPGTF